MHFQSLGYKIRHLDLSMIYFHWYKNFAAKLSLFLGNAWWLKYLIIREDFSNTKLFLDVHNHFLMYYDRLNCSFIKFSSANADSYRFIFEKLWENMRLILNMYTHAQSCKCSSAGTTIMLISAGHVVTFFRYVFTRNMLFMTHLKFKKWEDKIVLTDEKMNRKFVSVCLFSNLFLKFRLGPWILVNLKTFFLNGMIVVIQII